MIGVDECPEPLRVAVRAHTEPVDSAQGAAGRRFTKDWRALVRRVLIFDTETTSNDRYQSLMFGCWRFCEVDWQSDGRPQLVCVQEGLIYADELPDTNSKGFELLRLHARTREPWTDSLPRAWPAAPAICLVSRREFIRLFHLAAYKARATVVGFNLPFDISRLAVNWGEARGRFTGGFSFILHDYEKDGDRRRENRYRSRVAVHTINSKAAFIGFDAPAEIDTSDRIPEDAADGKPDKDYRFRGHFLDLRTLAFSHTDESHSLESACDKFGVPYTKRDVQHGDITSDYIEYCREDVQATGRLCEALLSEHSHHDINLQPTRAYSPASIGKAHLQSMRVKPVLERAPDFSAEVLGYAMSAYYGGRAECRIRRQPIPVVYTDFLSMYATVCSLMELWSLMTSDSVQAVETDPAEIERWVGSLDGDTLLDPERWPYLRVLVQIKPDGDILPVRARYGDTQSYGIGVNRYTTPVPQWYALPDVAASALLTGYPARVLRALRIEGSTRRACGLRPVWLRGKVKIDPRQEDFFRRVIEQRKLSGGHADLPAAERDRLGRFLKVLANSTSYGIYAEMNRQEQPAGPSVPVTVHGLESFTATVSTPEYPGPFYFSPIACLIPAAARLMLALLERQITDLDGTYAFCDTDSMAIVATRDGGPVPCPGGPHRTSDGQPAIYALSWEQVQSVTQRFEALNPYDRGAVPGSILEIEDINYTQDTDGNPTRELRQLHCYAISAKRYALYTMTTDAPKLAAIGGQEHADDDESDGSSRLLRLNGQDKHNTPDGAHPDIADAKQHGLGHLLNPADPDDDNRDWITQLWEHIVRIDGHGLSSPEPAWLDRPALTRITITTPRHERPFRPTSGQGSSRSSRSRRTTTALPDRPYQRVRPYNFLLTAHIAPLGHPPGADTKHFQLVAPYNRDPRQWKKLAWIDTYTMQNYQITTTGPPGESEANVKTYRDVLREYRNHPEPKSAGPDGRPCTKETRGLLMRRHVIPAGHIHHIGKESNKLEDREAGLVHDPAEVLNEYPNPAHDDFRTLVVPVLREPPAAGVKRETGLSERTIRRARKGDAAPHPSTRAKLTMCAARYARRRLRAAGIKPPATDDLAALAAYLQHQQNRHDPTEITRCNGCRKPLAGRQRRWCSDACRKRTGRQR
jgi:hypothetical protein